MSRPSVRQGMSEERSSRALLHFVSPLLHTHEVRLCTFLQNRTKNIRSDENSPVQIERYNANNGTHTLFYEDGEVRDSDMSQRGFRVCLRPPGWTPPPELSAADPSAVGHTSYATEEAPAGQHPQDAVWGRRRQSPLAPRPPADFAPDTSAHVLAALNRFGEAGGMAPLAQRLSGGRAPFGEVLEAFRLGKALRTHASSRALKETNWALKECAVAALLSAPPESMRAATKAEIAECVASVRQLALTLSSPGTAANPPVVLLQEMEQLELAMAMKVNERVQQGRRGAAGRWLGGWPGESMTLMLALLGGGVWSAYIVSALYLFGGRAWCLSALCGW